MQAASDRKLQNLSQSAASRSAFLAKYFNDQIKEDRIDGSRDTHVEEESNSGLWKENMKNSHCFEDVGIGWENNIKMDLK